MARGRRRRLFPGIVLQRGSIHFPLLVVAYWFCHPFQESWLRRVLHWIPYGAAVAVCAIIRVKVMGRFSEVSLSHEFSSRVVWAATGLLGEHAKLFFWPFNLSEFRVFDLAASLRSPWPWVAIMVLVAACWWRKSDPRLSFLLLWWVVTLSPTLNYRHLSIPLVADRFSYLPSVGLCLALGYVAFGWLPEHFPKIAHASVVVGAVAAVATLWAAQTLRAIPHWSNNDALFNYSLRVSPDAAEVHASHGVVLQLRDNNLEGAAREFRTALRLNAQSLQPITKVTYNSYIGLGQIALDQGREQEALDYFNKAVRLLRNFNFAYDVLGSVYFPRGDYARAAEYFHQAINVNPLDMGARFYLGTCLMKLGKPMQAAEQFRAARDVDPDFTQAYQAEALALEAAGDFAGAVKVRELMGKN